MNNTVTISTYIINGDIQDIGIGSPVIDFVSKSESKMYRVVVPTLVNDTSSNTQGLIDVSNQDILVKFIVYSGSPDIKISFDSNFSQLSTQDNWYV